MNIIDYVKKSKSTFEASPINEVDSLVFAELAYLNFSHAQTLAPKHTLAELAENIEQLVAGTLLYKQNVRLLKAIRKSPRFAGVEVGYFRRRNIEKQDVRFSAVTFRLTPESWHISFRGTGTSLVGWKENLKMALMDVIPTQRIGLKYLCDVASRTQGVLTVGGLSKGGNLSTFSATFAPKQVQDRISCVFDHDGPGFRWDIFGDPRFHAVADKVRKTVPHDSIVGMLLTASDKYEVVESSGVSIGQHDPFTWQVKGDGFKKLPKTTRASQATDKALTEWLAQMDQSEKKKFVKTVFTVVEGSGAKTVGDFLVRPMHKLRLMRKTFDKLDEESKELFSNGGRQLIGMWLDKIFVWARLRKSKNSNPMS